MLYFLYGSNDFMSLEKLNQIKSAFKAKNKNNFNLSEFRAMHGFNFNDFKASISINSLFDGKRLVIIRGFLNNVLLDIQEKIINSLENNNIIKDEQVIVVFYETGSPDKRKKSFKFLKNNTISQEFKVLQGNNLRNWIKSRIKNYKVVIKNNNVIEKLIISHGNDLWGLSNEIEKLVNYAGEDGIIQEKDIDLLVRAKIESNIFHLIESLPKNKKTSLKLLYKQLEIGDNELYILTMIIYQFRLLLKIKSLLDQNIPQYILYKKAGLHPFVVRQNINQAKEFSLSFLKNTYNNLLDLDKNIKFGIIEPRLGLERFVYSAS
ncbi:DNA polymerase III subunit delta [bacterium]|nr:DNA polymerase III subunit delta [bacterium]|tara:strand:- start:731 stop:1690 length:960 start_codon:yes stop_codon:yes gene_type:complete